MRMWMWMFLCLRLFFSSLFTSLYLQALLSLFMTSSCLFLPAASTLSFPFSLLLTPTLSLSLSLSLSLILQLPLEPKIPFILHIECTQTQVALLNWLCSSVDSLKVSLSLPLFCWFLPLKAQSELELSLTLGLNTGEMKRTTLACLEKQRGKPCVSRVSPSHTTHRETQTHNCSIHVP